MYKRQALEKDSVSFIEQVYTSKDNRKVRTNLEESQKLWMDFLAAGDAVDVYLKGKVRIDVGNLFSLENIVNLTARYKKGDEKARKEQEETEKEEASTEKKQETSKDDEAEKEEDKKDDQDVYKRQRFMNVLNLRRVRFSVSHRYLELKRLTTVLTVFF